MPPNVFGEQKLPSGSVMPAPIADIPSKSGTADGESAAVVEADITKWQPDYTFEDARRAMHEFAAERDWDQYHTPRNLALALSGEVGEVCECFQWRTAQSCADGLAGFTEAERCHVGEELADVLAYAVRLADRCAIHLPNAIAAKVALNEKKYPVALARGRASRYTEYARVTGFDAGARQYTAQGAAVDCSSSGSSSGGSDSEGDGGSGSGGGSGGGGSSGGGGGCSGIHGWGAATLESVRRRLEEFVEAREWGALHTPRDLCLALCGEAGELCECFLWRGEDDCAPGLRAWTDEQRDHLAQEISDVVIYLMRLSDRCGVDLARAFAAKMRRNAAKYPAHLARGRANKYTDYVQARAAWDGDASQATNDQPDRAEGTGGQSEAAADDRPVDARRASGDDAETAGLVSSQAEGAREAPVEPQALAAAPALQADPAAAALPSAATGVEAVAAAVVAAVVATAVDAAAAAAAAVPPAEAETAPVEAIQQSAAVPAVLVSVAELGVQTAAPAAVASPAAGKPAASAADAAGKAGASRGEVAGVAREAPAVAAAAAWRNVAEDKVAGPLALGLLEAEATAASAAAAAAAAAAAHAAAGDAPQPAQATLSSAAAPPLVPASPPHLPALPIVALPADEALAPPPAQCKSPESDHPRAAARADAGRGGGGGGDGGEEGPALPAALQRQQQRQRSTFDVAGWGAMAVAMALGFAMGRSVA